MGRFFKVMFFSRFRLLCLLLVAGCVLGMAILAPQLANAQQNGGGAPAEQSSAGIGIVWDSIKIIIERILFILLSNFKIDSWPFGLAFFLISIGLLILLIVLLLDLRLGVAIPLGFVDEFTNIVNRRQFKQAFDMCRADNSFLGRVLMAGMGRLQYGLDDARHAAGNMVESIRRSKDQLINYVATVGTVAPLVGLFGTVWGMIGTFGAIEASGDPDPRLMSARIMVSLGTTAVGIMVAVPALFFNTFFRNRLTRITMDTSNLSDDLMTQMYHNSRKPGASGLPGTQQAAAATQAPAAGKPAANAPAKTSPDQIKE